jgi:hypothetical protein
VSLTVSCVLVSGHVAYSSDYVLKLRSMCERYIHQHFDFVCLSDRPISGIEVIRIATPARGQFGWWAKMELWKRRRFHGRVLYLDLDTLVVDDLAPIINYPAQFALVPDGAMHFTGKDGRKTVKRYNSSVMVWDADSRPQLANVMSDEVTQRLWGDQDLIGERCPNEICMPLAWFPRISEVHAPPWPADAKVILMKKPKNAEAARRYEWMRDWWR